MYCLPSAVFYLCAFILFILVLAVLGLPCSPGVSLVVASRGSVWLWPWASHQGGVSFRGAEAPARAGLSSLSPWPQWLLLPGPRHRLNNCGKWASLLRAGGIFADLGLNLCLLHWQACGTSLSTSKLPWRPHKWIHCYEHAGSVVLENSKRH